VPKRTTTNGIEPLSNPNQHNGKNPEDPESQGKGSQYGDSSDENHQQQEQQQRPRRTNKIRKSLKITQWNVRSITAQENKLALKHYLANHQPDILVLVETWAKTSINFENDGYLVHQTEFATHQGVAILVKEEFTIKKTLSLGTRLLAVEVTSREWLFPVTVVGSYHQATDGDLCRTLMTFMSNANL
jgi:acetoin utilization deacetylase AcuC-like enzyme